jgi:hypothetical protein
MKKFEDKDTVILLMTKKEATALYNALVNTNVELGIMIKAGNGTEAVTKTDSEICTEAQQGLTDIRYTLGNIDPIVELAKKYAHPQVYDNNTEGYREIEALEGEDWEKFLGELGRYGMSCNYCNAMDTFTIG